MFFFCNKLFLISSAANIMFQKKNKAAIELRTGLDNASLIYSPHYSIFNVILNKNILNMGLRSATVSLISYNFSSSSGIDKIGKLTL